MTSTLEGVRTLVLDRAFRPLKAIPWHRAIVLDLSSRVEVLEYYELVVRTPADAFPLPAVIRLPQFLGIYPFRVALTRKNLLARDNHQCQYCGTRPSARDLTLDHVMPRSRGGASTWENLITACSTCNHRKGNRTPSEARMCLLSKPARPKIPPAGRRGLSGTLPTEWLDYLPLAS